MTQDKHDTDTLDPQTAPFGRFRPNGFQQMMRDWGERLPASQPRSLLKSTLFRLAGGKQETPKDVKLFDGVKVRLYPYDNVCEKRAYLAVQSWDAKERAHIKKAIEETKGENFYFLDVGANVGLYSLYTEAVARELGKKARILAIEPEPVVLARLQKNIEFSRSEIKVLPVAITDKEQEVVIAPSGNNRGENKISQDANIAGAVKVPGKPLQMILEEEGVPRVDFMKIDVEGYERPILVKFFAEAPKHLFPKRIVLETLHNEGPEKGGLSVCLENGYEILDRSRMNAILGLQGGA